MMTDTVEKSSDTIFLLFCLICKIMAKREDRSESYDIIRIVAEENESTDSDIVILLKKKKSEYNFVFHKFRTKCIRVVDRRPKKSHRVSEG